MQSVSCVSSAEIEAAAAVAPDAGDMLAALAQTQKHVGQFVCEIDGRDTAAWEDIARAFDGDDSPGSRRELSHLLLWRHGEIVAGARIAISRFPGLRGGHAVVHGGPFWRLRGGNPDLTVYRAMLGALVQEYCIRRGHRLTITRQRDDEEMLALRSFGFVRALRGGYAFRIPYAWRIMDTMLGALHAVRRTMTFRYARA